MYPFFAELIKINRLVGVKYCEPYAGGAGLAIRLLANGFVSSVAINDIDRSIYAFWVSALRETDDFCTLIESTPITIDEWYRQQEIWGRGNLARPMELGFAAYFLNRTNRSGIIEGAGPIGGYTQSSEWKIDVRLVKEKQITNLQMLSKYAEQIDISNLDALTFLETKRHDLESLIYLDPPYFVKGHKLYNNFYTKQDHERIASELKAWRHANWIVSYDDVPHIRMMYDTFPAITYSLNYSAGSKTTGAEVIFISDTLEPPSIAGYKLAA